MRKSLADKLADELDGLRVAYHDLQSRHDRLLGWFVIVFIALFLSLSCNAMKAFGQEFSDPLNEDLQTAAADALAMANHTGGHARVRYVSLYAIPPDNRDRAAQAISVLAHQLSHAGIPLLPSRVTETLIRLQLELYDPFGVGWAAGWEETIPSDRRWHIDATSGTVSEVLFSFEEGNRWVPAELVELRDTEAVVIYKGNRQTVKRQYFRQREAIAKAVYGAWVDIEAAQQLAELTGSEGALLDCRDFAYAASWTPIYYTFRNTPKTLKEWRAKWGETKVNGFGLFGVRGANLDRSGVTGAPRGIQRWRLAIWETFDVDKSKEFTDDKNPFVFPERTATIDATEALALMPNGGLDCFIANGDGARVHAVPGAVAIDTSYGVRELRPGLSCWSCHSQVRNDEEMSGFLPFRDKQTAKRAATKDPALAAKLAAYYSDTARLQRDLAKDRADFKAGVIACTADPSIEHSLAPSEAFEALNWLVSQVTDDPIDPTRACWELGLGEQDDPVSALNEYLAGTTRDGLTDLMQGDSIHFQRFRLALPEALERIHARRTKEKADEEIDFSVDDAADAVAVE